MHKKPLRIIPAVLVLLVLAAAAYWFLVVRPAQNGQAALTASGSIEMTEVHIGPELGGRVTEVRVVEGDPVKAGDSLVLLDDSLLKAQRAQAAAALDIARANASAARSSADAAQAAEDAARQAQDASQAIANAAQASLDLIKAGATTEQLAAAQAQLAQAESGRQAAQASFAAFTSGARPEDVTAARARLDLARQEYYSLTVVLSSQQVEDVRAVLNTAQANLTQAETRVADLKKDTRTPAEALDAASVAVRDASANRDLAQAALDAAQGALDAAQNTSLPFFRQIEASRRTWESAQLELSQAKARQTSLQGVADITQTALADAGFAVDDAQKLVDGAKTAYDGLNTSDQGTRLKTAWEDAQSALTDLNRLGKGANANVEAAMAQMDSANAGRDLASANLASVENGARPEQLTAAQAQLDAARAQLEMARTNVSAAQAKTKAAQDQAVAAQAQVDASQAALDALDVQIGKLILTSPINGVVLSRTVEPGEFAAPGSTFFILGRISDLTITVYIPEDRYGQINLGQAADVRVDSFPGASFNARVVHIADKAEFTPRNVQTAQGRKDTVFAIKLQVDNPEGKLKAGMPADVVFK